ncbi:hypothetical protein NXC24_CH00879 [Rhizobium sp. NXC24]|nr:hypothetical protein NXC24_CH00879 [Rhizobium sp. NXC24]
MPILVQYQAVGRGHAPAGLKQPNALPPDCPPRSVKSVVPKAGFRALERSSRGPHGAFPGCSRPSGFICHASLHHRCGGSAGF